MPLTLAAPAKINLGLHVLRKREDGYHDLETVFYRVGWHDTVMLRPSTEITMTCSDPSLPTDGDNLCIQAAQRLAEQIDAHKGAKQGEPRGAAIHLEKRVPYGAGLGGGSSDAAATLRGLLNLWDADVPADVLHSIGASIGSDVPFFLLDDAPAAYATGRGDNLTPLQANGDPLVIPYAVVVVAPPVEIATPVAYQHVTPNATDRPDVKEIVASLDLGRWRAELRNDFEGPIAAAYPSVAAAHDVLHDYGADYVSLSGSGSAVYGIFTSPTQAESAQEAAVHEGYRAHCTLPESERTM